MEAILDVRNLSKELPNGKVLLRSIAFSLQEGEFTGILGPSGAGKSLTIRCIAGLTKPTEGEALVRGPQGTVFSMGVASGRQLRKARAGIGVIFQGLHLVKRLSALENVMIGRLGRIHPLRSWLYGFADGEAEEAMQVLDRMGLAGLAARRSGTLSGGELQRVAICRAIFQQPSLYLADEPIASLDPRNAEAIMGVLRTLSRETPVLAALHQPEMARQYCTRILGIRQGQLIYDGLAAELDNAALREIYGPEAFEAPAYRAAS